MEKLLNRSSSNRPSFVSSSQPKLRILPSNVKLVNGIPCIQGRKKALFIGINYVGTDYALKGGFNDIMSTRSLLIEKFGFPDDPESMLMLTDVGVLAQGRLPTRRNMIQALQWLVQNALPGDSLVFHYSGHGGKMRDMVSSHDVSHDELEEEIDSDAEFEMELTEPSSSPFPSSPFPHQDASLRTTTTLSSSSSSSSFSSVSSASSSPFSHSQMDVEVILPLDVEESGVITEDELYSLLVEPLPQGARLTVIFDSCHNGTALKLPRMYLVDNEKIQHHVRKRKPSFFSSSSSISTLSKPTLEDPTSSSFKSVSPPSFHSLPRKVSHSFFNFFLGRRKSLRTKQDHTGQVFLFSGRRDDRFGLDEEEGGAMSWTLGMVLKSQTVVTYAELLNSTYEIMKSAFHQTPQLSTVHPLDMEEVFAL